MAENELFCDNKNRKKNKNFFRPAGLIIFSMLPKTHIYVFLAKGVKILQNLLLMMRIH